MSSRPRIYMKDKLCKPILIKKENLNVIPGVWLQGATNLSDADPGQATPSHVNYAGPTFIHYQTK